MKNMLKSVCLLAVLALAFTSCQKGYESVKGDALNTRIYTLDNGLKVYLSQNSEKPEVQTYIAVHAGGLNDPSESTGLAHYQEHIMFKGTQQYGTTDYAAEKVYLDQIDSLYEVYGHTNCPEARKAIYHQIDSVSYLSSKLAIANEFDKLMDGIGASGVNAFTTNEMTCYHEVIPAGELSRWAAIESDRFKNLVIRGFHTELETVYEEFNMYSTMDQMKVIQAINNILYPELDYRQHEVIGTQEHLQNPSLLNMRKFYETYYRPNNVAICLAGDFDYDEAIATIKAYFGDWQPNPAIPSVEKVAPTVLTEPKDTIVLGNEAPMMWLGWRFPAAGTPEAEIVEIMAEVLNNGKCGLLDLDINQQQKMMGSAVMPDWGVDYTTVYVVGMGQEGQSLDEVKNLLLPEIEKLKAGDFSEEMLHAIIANKRKNEMKAQQSNEARCSDMADAFIYGTPWSEVVGRLDRQAKISKEDIVRVANEYFTNGYAVVYKQIGTDPTMQKISKPAISPIEMNRGVNSAFADSILAVETPALKPQFLDFEKDLTRSELNGRELLYRQNTENELFNLVIISNGGSFEQPELDMAKTYIDYLGTTTRSAEELQAKLYNLAADMFIYVADQRVQFSVSGLQENLSASLAVLEDHLMNSVADQPIYDQLVADLIRGHEDEKTAQRSCFSELADYGQYGAEAKRHSTLLPAEMRALKPEQLLQEMREKALHNATIVYYGPASLSEVKDMLKNSPLLQETPNTEDGKHSKTKRVEKAEVLIAPYNAPTIYYQAFADWGEVYDPRQEALVMLFNQYFSGSMGSVVFQEMREARALAYTAQAYYSTAQFAGDDNCFTNFIISQTDKTKDCVEAFAEICDNMPQSESTFAQAKAAMLKQIEQRRYTREAPIWSFLAMRRYGWDHDWYEDIYREAQTLTMNDLVQFQQEHVKGRTYRYLILGDPKKLDMNYLKTLGEVKLLTLEDIFIY